MLASEVVLQFNSREVLLKINATSFPPYHCYIYISLSPSSPSLFQIQGEVVAGFSSDKASKAVKKASAARISLAIRDRPFERTITMQKDSANHVGFSYNNGEIKAIVKDSSAAR